MPGQHIALVKYLLSKVVLKQFEKKTSRYKKRNSIDTGNSKTKYYFKLANKLSSKKLNQKCYWSILKSFLNGKKIPCIPPIFHNDNFITDIREKSELFNTFFAQQCSLIENSSTLPTCIFPKTDKYLQRYIFLKKTY